MTTHLFDTRTLSTYQMSQPINQSSQTLAMPASTAPQPIDQTSNHSFITRLLENIKRNRLKYVFGSLTLVTGLAAYLAYRRQVQSNIERRRNLHNRHSNRSNDPHTLTDYELHAARCMKAGDLAGAYHCLSDAIDMSPETPTLYLNRANVCFLMNDFDNCLEDANACIRCYQQRSHSSHKPINLNGLALLMKGRALVGLEDYENACHVIEQAIHSEKRMRRENPSYSGKHGDQLVLDVMQECLTDALECVHVKQNRERIAHQLNHSSSQSSVNQSTSQPTYPPKFEVKKPQTVRSTNQSHNQSIDKSLSAIHHSASGSAFVPVYSAAQLAHNNFLPHPHHEPIIDRVMHAIPNPAAHAHHRDADDNQALYQPYSSDHLAPSDYLEEPMSPVSPVSPASPSILDAMKAVNATAEKARLRAIARKARAKSTIHQNVTLPNQPAVEREKSRAKSVDERRPNLSDSPSKHYIIDVTSESMGRSIHANGVDHRHREPRLVV